MAVLRLSGLRAVRAGKQLSRQALAEKAGCSMATISASERGQVVSPLMARKIADALGCEVRAIGEEIES